MTNLGYMLTGTITEMTSLDVGKTPVKNVEQVILPFRASKA